MIREGRLGTANQERKLYVSEWKEKGRYVDKERGDCVSANQEGERLYVSKWGMYVSEWKEKGRYVSE